MRQDSSAFIELRDLQLHADIGTYGPNETRPDIHLLNLRLGIAVNQVVISQDDMANVFDYDPLVMAMNKRVNGVLGDLLKSFSFLIQYFLTILN